MKKQNSSKSRKVSTPVYSGGPIVHSDEISEENTTADNNPDRIYDFKEIEEKFKEKWFTDNVYEAIDFSDKPKKYILCEFPYPSGKSMHVGHVMRYTVPEIYSRFLRMKGYNVLFPMGWDAFGLPAENFAIKTGTHPAVKTEELVTQYRAAMQGLGYGIDWEREINTTDSAYYKWTQWIFLKFFEAGLAELKEEPVWWCEAMKTVLAEEEVIKDKDGNLISERGEHPVERKLLKQWVLKITEYADKLLEGLDETDFPESIKSAQSNWIGRSEGVNINYEVDGSDEVITCFTTTPVNYGMTFIVLAPEHEIIESITTSEQKKAVEEYVQRTKNKTELERMQEGKDKTGVFTGAYAVNPFNNSKVPIWVADFVLASVGTGAVQGCPAHDERDFEFAKKFDLPIVRVVVVEDGYDGPVKSVEQVKAKGSQGKMINSGPFDGMEFAEAMQKTMDYIEEQGWGKRVINYKLRDWIFSRQRYWGEPIPLIHKQDGTIEAIVHTEIAEEVAEKLPLELPEVPDYNPTSDGSSPLAANSVWVNTTDSEGKAAKRETNTMPNWAGSSWYYLRYCDPKNNEQFADFDKLRYWLPVDRYFGGSEHTTLHLLYSRFWHKFLYDQGKVPTSEPYQWRMNGGILLASDNTKMSKSKGNVVEPQEKLDEFGADALRMQIAFLGPYDATFPYNVNSIKTCYSLIKTIYKLQENVDMTGQYDDLELRKQINKSIKRMTEMAETLRMNTMVAEYMILVKHFKAAKQIPLDIWKDFIKLLAPIAVFTSEQLWQEINGYEEWDQNKSVHVQEWPSYDEAYIIEDEIEIPVQINGKLRGTVKVLREINSEELQEIIEKDSALSGYINGSIAKFIYVPEKIANVIVK